MSQEFSQEIIDLKNKQRAALKREYLRQFTNPHTSSQVFDPAVQRFLSLQVSRINYFKETPRTVLSGFLFIVLPLTAIMYTMKNKREKLEHEIRTGQIAYKDRLFKLQ